MKYFGNDELSEKHKELSKIITKTDEINRAKMLFLEIHGQLHSSVVSNGNRNEVDKIFEDLSRTEYAIMPTSQDETIAWVVWHIARIEDLTINILVDKNEQVFNSEWAAKLNTPISDTGNALSDDEIISLSNQINIDELLQYRILVGQRTRSVVGKLTHQDMKRKVSPDDLERILAEGGVTSQTESKWLLDFWGKKNVSGILLMPPTRHVMLHLNDCAKWKQHVRSGKSGFR